MRKSNEELQDEFLQIQHKGKQSLRLFLLLFVFLLFCYCGVQCYAMSLLYEDFFEQLYSYVWPVALQLLWLFPIWKLWKYHRIGKLLYIICEFMTLYWCKDMYVYMLMEHTQLTYPIYMSFGFACIWRLFTIMGLIKLFHNAKIRSIWSVYDMFDEELDEDEELTMQTQPPKKETPVEKKAKQHLHSYAVRMGLMLYIYMVIALVIVLVLKGQLPQMKESFEIIERALYGSFLFTAFLWILPITAIYMYHRSARWLLLLCFIAELIKAIISFESYAYILTSPLVTSFSRMLFIGIEIMRFLILLWWSQKVIRDPYSYYYWKKKGA